MGWMKPPASCWDGGGAEVVVWSMVAGLGGFVEGGADQEGDGGRSLGMFWPEEAAKRGESSSIVLAKLCSAEVYRYYEIGINGFGALKLWRCRRQAVSY